jgi:hypothetical protein
MGLLRRGFKPSSSHVGNSPPKEKPTSPFKLNLEWMKEEEFINKLKEVWVPFDGSLREYTPIQFHQNLKKSKKIAIRWAKEKK